MLSAQQRPVHITRTHVALLALSLIALPACVDDPVAPPTSAAPAATPAHPTPARIPEPIQVRSDTDRLRLSPAPTTIRRLPFDPGAAPLSTTPSERAPGALTDAATRFARDVTIARPAPDSHLTLRDEALEVALEFNQPLPRGALTVTLLAGRSATTAATRVDVTEAFEFDGARATGRVQTTATGPCTLLVRVDLDGDGAADTEEAATFTIARDRDVASPSVARQWNEVLLDAIRVDTPRPTVHARNLFHLSVLMWDCWVAYDPFTDAAPYLDTTTRHAAFDLAAARHACISQGAHRLLRHRFERSIGAETSLPEIDQLLHDLGYDAGFIPASVADSSPEAVGYRIADALIAHGLQDGANEVNDYADPNYRPYNGPLIFKLPGTNGSVYNPNRWSPLAFDFRCFQNDTPVPSGGETQVFVGSNWNDVAPFALTREGDGLYLDPGPPPMAVEWDTATRRIVGPGDLEFKEQMLAVVRYSARLNPDDAPVLNLSPRVTGDNSLAGIAQGVFDGQGHGINPATGEPYPDNWVNEADFGRVVAEFWADGPDSETPPGHWNTLFNTVNDHPALVRRVGGVGPEVGPLEWDVKGYLALNGALHDAAVAAWGVKAAYDYTRPIAGIRWLTEQGQSSDPDLPGYSEHGMLLEEGLVEVITTESSAPGARHEHLADHVGELAFHVWPGEPNRDLPPQCGEPDVEPDPDLEIPPYSGREWVLGVSWITYQRRTFVTPPFAAYVSGHSTFSRAAAEVLTRLTGSPYFPGGLGEFVALQNDFLAFETGPTETVRLQWATYRDAADQAGISRLWGGIHVAADDLKGRVMGAEIGVNAYDLAHLYWGD